MELAKPRRSILLPLTALCIVVVTLILVLNQRTSRLDPYTSPPYPLGVSVVRLRFAAPPGWKLYPALWASGSISDEKGAHYYILLEMRPDETVTARWLPGWSPGWLKRAFTTTRDPKDVLQVELTNARKKVADHITSGLSGGPPLITTVLRSGEDATSGVHWTLRYRRALIGDFEATRQRITESFQVSPAPVSAFVPSPKTSKQPQARE